MAAAECRSPTAATTSSAAPRACPRRASACAYLSSTSTIPANNAANLIADNALYGVDVVSGTGDGIRGNSIHDNGSAGIGLGSGANLNQPAPVLGVATLKATGVQVTGSLTATAHSTYTIEFFANYASGSSGNIFLGTATVTTGATGVAAINTTLARPPAGATYITATATDASNDTSVFSNAVLD